ncbi:MAG: methyltransferase domain-containing protein, partial [Gammaproteobacteria bacterium]|nr:methyltransferase domain-containing protein [Gammaproteobacteria bacterium]
DLQRVHRAMRSLSILLRAISRLHLQAPPRRIIELGAGDGTLLLRLLRALRTSWPGGDVILLDQHDLVSEATRTDLARLGWTVQALRADAIEWARSARGERFDLCLTTLFLHHFRPPDLTELLAAVAARADAFVACEPRRNAFSRLASQLLILLGANEITRHDAATSVDAGFAARELSALWPQGADAWRIEEYFAYPFTHCLAARRLIVPHQ